MHHLNPLPQALIPLCIQHFDCSSHSKSECPRSAHSHSDDAARLDRQAEHGDIHSTVAVRFRPAASAASASLPAECATRDGSLSMDGPSHAVTVVEQTRTPPTCINSINHDGHPKAKPNAQLPNPLANEPINRLGPNSHH